jgi:tetratricopeptide (TPR) repeat protein
MRLVLTIPDGWTVKQAPGDKFVAVLPGGNGSKPRAIITYGPMRPKPENARSWIESVAGSERGEGTSVAIGRHIDRETRDGWSMHLVEVEISDGANVVESRLCAFYTFMEHAAHAIARTGSLEAMGEKVQELDEILATGRPEWRQKVCLADLWDFEVGRGRARDRTALGRGPGTEPNERDQELATVSAAVRRGGILLGLERHAEALDALEEAIELDDGSEPARYFAGLALLGLDRKTEAIGRWREALELAPDSVDTHYNIGQACYELGDFEAALASFTRVTELAPDDFLARRKVIQCLYALDRFEEGFAERKRFREQWSRSRDPRAKVISEYVFDQFAGDGYMVHALETLRPRNPKIYALLIFQAVVSDDRPLSASVLVETSDKARAAGTPFVIGVEAGGEYKVVSLEKDLPHHKAMRREVLRLLDQAMTAADEAG